MAWTSGTFTGVWRAAAALALLLPAGAPAAEPPSPPTPPEITEVGGKKLDDWIKDLGNSDPSVREEAIRAVALFPNANKAVPALLERLHDSDESPRVKAAQALAIIKIDDDKKAEVAKKLGERLNG